MRRAWIPVVLLILTAAALLVRWQASAQVSRMLRGWAISEVASQSDSVYRLAVGNIRFVWSLRRFTVDSLLLSTNAAAQARQRSSRPDLTVLMRNCTVGGVSIHRLVLRRGIHATRLGCATVHASVNVPEQQQRFDAHSSGEKPEPGGFLVLQRNLDLPVMIPRVRISRVSFPSVVLVLDRPAAFGGITRFELGRLTWNATGLVIDPDDPAAARRPLFSRSTEILARDLELHPDTLSSLAIGTARFSLADSVMELAGIAWEPHGSNIEVARAGPYRRDPLRVRAARVDATGVDFYALVAGFATRARRIGLDSLDIELYSDKRMPKKPADTVHRTPQQWLADLRMEVRVDSVVLRDAQFIYRERRPGYDRNALLSFTGIQGVATNARHVPGRRTTSRARDSVPGPDVLRLETSSVFQGEGRFQLTITIPTNAPTFEMTFDGALQRMPGTALNPLVETTQPARITGGTLDGLTLRGTISNGMARGFVTVRYHDLTMQVTGQGTNGWLRAGGLVGGLARTVASVRLNTGVIRQDNPSHDGARPRTGTIARRFTSTETLPGFLWKSTRGALLEVVLK